MNLLKQGVNFVKGAVKKTANFVVEAGTKAYIAVGASISAIVGSTPAKADLATDLATIETAATTGLSSVGSSQAIVAASVFALIIFGVAVGWIVKTVRSR